MEAAKSNGGVPVEFAGAVTGLNCFDAKEYFSWINCATAVKIAKNRLGLVRSMIPINIVFTTGTLMNEYKSSGWMVGMIL